MKKSNKQLKKNFFDRDVVIIVILVMINIVIIGYGKIRDKNSTKELLSLQEASSSKVQTSTESRKEEIVNKILNKEIKNKEMVLPRNSYLEDALNNGKFKGLILGDSIGQGVGATSINILESEIGSGIFKNINMMSKEQFMSDNYSVGGSTIENILAYIADNGNGKSKAYEYQYWILVTGRNEMEAMTVEQFKNFYRMVVTLGEKNGIDVICVTEPPQIDMSNGQLIQNSYSQYKKVIEEIAAEEGATLINVYNGLLKKKDAGENISKLSSNGILPNDEGYKYIAELITEGIVGNNIEFKKPEGKSDIKLMTQYIVKDEVEKLKIQSLSTKGTAKEFNTGNKEVMALKAGENITVDIPDGEVMGAVVTLVSSNNGGSLEVKTSGGELSKIIKSLGTQTREVSYFITLDNIKEIKELKKLMLSPKGNVYVSGVTFIIKN